MDPLVNGVIGFQQAALSSKIDYAVARKMLDSQAQTGEAMVQLIDAAGKGVTQAGDQLAAAATGLGGQVDVQA